jgi:hypothetical protein
MREPPKRTEPRHSPYSVFARTVAGDAQSASSSLTVSPRLRRVLSVIDGQRSLRQLQQFTRPEELAMIIDALQARGLIELRTVLVPQDPEQTRQEAAHEAVILSGLKQTLRGCFEHTLGVDGRVIDARIADGVSLAVLKRALREGIERVIAAHGDSAAGPILKRAREVFAARGTFKGAPPTGKGP